MMRILAVILFFIPICLSAQVDLREEFTTVIRENDPRLLLKYEVRNGFISNRFAKVSSIKIGANYGRYLSVGLGYNLMFKPISLVERNSELRLAYFAPFVEYKFYNKHPFYASIPLQVGIGSVSEQFNESGVLNRTALLTYEAMLNGEVRFLMYFGAGIGLGYRLFFFNQNKINNNLSSPIYVLKFNCYFEDIYNDIRSK